MKPIYKITTATVLIAGGIWAGSILNTTADGASVGTQPGTADDPVVTKSYVDQQILKAIQGGTITAPSTTTAPVATQAPVATKAPVATQAPGTGTSTSNEVVIVDVKPGQTLIASAGAEFIVRAGKAIIYSNDANGVADLTEGKDLTHGQTAPSNHLLSFPREGRGITVLNGQTYGLTVMVRGGYILQ